MSQDPTGHFSSSGNYGHILNEVEDDSVFDYVLTGCSGTGTGTGSGSGTGSDMGDLAPEVEDFFSDGVHQSLTATTTENPFSTTEPSGIHVVPAPDLATKVGLLPNRWLWIYSRISI